jgi:glutaminyl-peptide cyclotransferase
MLSVLAGTAGCTQYERTAISSPDIETVWFDFEIINTFPHDPDAFTQGLLFRDGYLFESTGRRGQSSLRKVDLETGDILMIHNLDPEYFGEGLTDVGDKLIQLTLDAGIGFVYDLETFSLIETFRYEGDGWGLANDGEKLIMSDGTPNLRFLDPVSFQETGRVQVTEGGEPVENLNEMVMVGDLLFANVLHTNHIAMINPENGVVESRIDLRELRRITSETAGQSINVLNGIAYDSENERLFVTGKLWPYLYEIEIFPKE